MKTTVETKLRTSYISIEGRFDAHEVARFREQMDDLLAAGTNQFRVDLSTVNFIDSSALAALVALSRSATTAAGSLEIHNPSAPTQVILELTGLDQALSIIASEESSNSVQAN